MPRITQLYAYVVADSAPDDEGVPAVQGIHGPMPLVGADVERALLMESAAQTIATRLGKPVELRVFTAMRTIKTIFPDTAAALGSPEGRARGSLKTEDA